MKAETPIQTSYQPELNISPEIKSEDGAYFHFLSGILIWILELGRIYICLEISMMSSNLALLREGNLEQMYHAFAYLKKYQKYELVLDPSDQITYQSEFEHQDWTSSQFFHVSDKEYLPQIIPDPYGLGFLVTSRLDAYNYGYTVKWLTRTGFIVY